MPSGSATPLRRSETYCRASVRKTEFGHRAHVDQAGQAAYGQFDRQGDLLLDLFRAERRCHGVDLHLSRRRVGKGIYR